SSRSMQDYPAHRDGSADLPWCEDSSSASGWAGRMSERVRPTGDSGPVIPAPAHDLRAVLRIAPFRTLWIALGLSSLGDWLGLLALTAMARQLAIGDYRAENFAIAGVLLLRLLPAVVVGPLGGYIAD